MSTLNDSNNSGLISSPVMPLIFDGSLLSSYDNEGKSNNGTLLENGNALRLEGDTWKKYKYPYSITANTVLDFDFLNEVNGTASAIGFDINNDFYHAVDKTFQIAGGQSIAWKYQTAFFSPSSDLRHITIEVGKYLTGTFNYLTFVNDHNIVNPNGVNVYSNIRLYERNLLDTVSPIAALTAPEITEKDYSYSFQVVYNDDAGIRLSSLDGKDLQIISPDGYSYLGATLTKIDSNPERTQVTATYTITSTLGWGVADVNGQYEVKLLADQVKDINGNSIKEQVIGDITINVDVPGVSPPSFVPISFDPSNLSSYSNEDIKGTATVLSGGNVLQLSGNTWKKYQYDYTITPETMLRFEFRSDKEGEEHAIGFDRDNFFNKNSKTAFQLHGYTSRWYYFKDHFDYSGTEWKTYEIEVGKYLTGTMQYLTFINDHDVSNPTSNSYFRNVSVYEPFVADTQKPTFQIGALANVAADNVNNPYIFTVTYQDNEGLDLGSFDGQELIVGGPNQFSAPVLVVDVSPSADGKSAQVTYQINSPFIYEENYYGQYDITVNGNRIKDINNNFIEPSLIGNFIVEPPPLKPPSEIGINVFRIANWSSEVPFIDGFKSSFGWIPQTDKIWDTKETINLDANGWVTSLPSSDVTYSKVTAKVLGPVGGNYLGGQYVVLYDGEGSIAYKGDATLVSRNSVEGQDIINVTPSSNGILLSITDTNPDDYLRNIRVVPADKVDTYTEQIFNPEFLEKIQPFSTIRFMNWMETNQSPEVNWSDRPTLETSTWMNRGVPVEVLVELANQTDANPWFSLPHMATDDYVRNFAEYVEANLEPELKVYVEYSNEVWNSGFSQYQWVRNQARQEWTDPSISDFNKVADWYSRRTTQITRIWDDVFEDTNPDRVIGVMGAFSDNKSWADRTFQYAWAEDPLTSKEYGVDALAIAPYFGYYIGRKNEAQVLEWTKTEADGGLGKLFDEITQGGKVQTGPQGGALQDQYRHMISHKQIADAEGLPLIAYEAGQHLTGKDPAVVGLFRTANRDPRMGEVYEAYLKEWNNIGGGLMVPFNFASPYLSSGSWGLLESVYDDQSPKYNAVLDFIQGPSGTGGI